MLIISPYQAFTQPADYPVTGLKCPEFTLHQIEYFRKQSVSLNDLRGNWLVLYFWTTGGPACVQGFPKLDQLQAEFANDAQFLLVGKNDERNKNIRVLYEKFRRQYNLQLSVVYETALSNRFVGKAAIPHVVIIDPQGIVVAVTEGAQLTRQAMADLVKGKTVPFSHKYNEYDATTKPRVNINKPLLINGNGGADADFRFRSLLSGWNPEYGIRVTSALSEQVPRGQFQGVGLSIADLYKYAYLGRSQWGIGDDFYGYISQDVLLEVKEPEPLQSSITTGKGRYNYSVIVPREKASESFLRQIMQSDLKNFFGYEVSIEERKMPYWKLIVSNPKQVKRADPQVPDSMYVDHATVRLLSGTTQQLLSIIEVYNQNQGVFIDSTKLAGKVEINLDGDMTNFEHVQKEIQKNGFSLIQEYKLTKTLVLRDPL